MPLSRPVYPEETGQDEASVEEAPQEVSLSKMEEEIQEDVDELSDEEGGGGGGAVFLDLNLSEHDRFKKVRSFFVFCYQRIIILVSLFNLFLVSY